MKRFLLVLWLLCTVMVIKATTEDVKKVDGLWYSVNNDKTEATVIAVPEVEEGSYTGSITISPTISIKVSEDSEEYKNVPVTAIKSSAFRAQLQ